MSSPDIHSTAVVLPGAVLAGTVVIGPYAIVEDGAVLGDGAVVGAHAVVHGSATLRPGVRIGVHAVIGGDPQDLKFSPQMPTRVEIGERTVIREFATVHRSTCETPTRVGRNCLLMGGIHVGHDCRIGDRVVLAQTSTLGGHVTVDDDAIIGGMTGVHQHVRIGRLAMVGAMAKVTRDVLPYMLVDGAPAVHWWVNEVGLNRHGVPPAERVALREALRALRRGGDLDGSAGGAVRDLLAFVAGPSPRGLAGFGRRGATT
ncbi:acyl-ACP--UDP-N-acetylglucosamine O-acyltransferase [Micromonospora sp. C95]|uniref:acyl-ACP--UDP-N-acetylglucosamine O-acyltransferase n=1 Tax=Micromonospora sp. C95 TaxID=2824882 RepID=UPI001B362EF2|nr:acyl-ACP--UDP-N-acetylglucosamine O-acyltransferase [Micromonospora sp. C95]MBQ1027543.1 acyl-ACP--UDP-N-acetylglucosamine O-acyltransferase [Micromonospora sp. C95]